jgi:hypothetical protein
LGLRPEDGRVLVLDKHIIEVKQNQDEKDEAEVGDNSLEGFGKVPRGNVEPEWQATIKVIDALPREAEKLSSELIDDEGEVGV